MAPDVNKPAEPLAIFQRRPEIGGDIAHPPAAIQQCQALFDKGQIEIPFLGGASVGRFSAGTRLKPSCHIGIYRQQIFLLDIRRVSNHGVEAFRREGTLPFKSIDAILLFRVIQLSLVVKAFVDQAVAAADRAIQPGKRLVGHGGVQPERELCDFDRGRIYIHAEQIVTQDHFSDPGFIRHRGNRPRRLRRRRCGGKFNFKMFERQNEEGTRSAGRIDNADFLQALPIGRRRLL